MDENCFAVDILAARARDLSGPAREAFLLDVIARRTADLALNRPELAEEEVTALVTGLVRATYAMLADKAESA